jgi:hypothetical protein
VVALTQILNANHRDAQTTTARCSVRAVRSRSLPIEADDMKIDVWLAHEQTAL